MRTIIMTMMILLQKMGMITALADVMKAMT